MCSVESDASNVCWTAERMRILREADGACVATLSSKVCRVPADGEASGVTACTGMGGASLVVKITRQD